MRIDYVKLLAAAPPCMHDPKRPVQCAYCAPLPSDRLALQREAHAVNPLLCVAEDGCSQA